MPAKLETCHATRAARQFQRTDNHLSDLYSDHQTRAPRRSVAACGLRQIVDHRPRIGNVNDQSRRWHDALTMTPIALDIGDAVKSVRDRVCQDAITQQR
jgi:hypothetical protein